MLTDEQRAELESLRPETVRLKLIQAGADPGALVPGFATGPFRGLTRSDVENSLAEKSTQEETERKQTLYWAVIAGQASIAGVIVGIVAIIVSIWLAYHH